MGWTPIHFWTKEVKKDLDGCIETVKETIFLEKIEDYDELNDD